MRIAVPFAAYVPSANISVRDRAEALPYDGRRTGRNMNIVALEPTGHGETSLHIPVGAVQGERQ